MDSNIELREDMTVVFPDATLNSYSKGFHTIDELKKTIEDISKSNSSIFSLYSAGTGYVRDYVDDKSMRAFPKQFPYGRGGPNERRMLTKN
jgi:hypothetical protein